MEKNPLVFLKKIQKNLKKLYTLSIITVGQQVWPQ